MAAAKQAAQAALAEIVDGTWFAVIAGSDRAMLAYPKVSSGPGMVQMDASTRSQASEAIGALRRQRRYGDQHLARPGRHALRVGARGHPAARHPAHRRREPRGPRQARRRDPQGHRRLPVRLPRGGHRLAGRGDPPDRPGPARHRRHHPGARPDAGAVPGDDAHLDEPRRRRRPAPRVDAAGRPGAVRPPGLADRGGPHRPPGGGQPAHRRLPHRRLGRRVPRLPRRRTRGREGDRAGAAGGPRAARASARTSSPRGW